MKSIIRFNSTQKPDGEIYKKITYWNRFFRNKLEATVLLITMLVAIVSAVYRLKTGTMDTFWAIFSLILFCYPFLVITQFNTSIRYHLRHRDLSETAPCEFTVMENGVLIDVPEPEVHKFIKFDELTAVYTDVLGHMMCFSGKKVVMVINKADVPADRLDDMLQMFSDGIPAGCKVKKH